MRIDSTVSRFTGRRIQQRLDQTLHIPPLPEAARRIIALQATDDYDLKDLVAIIETDPSITARIMGWANSAFYHVHPPASSIQDAVMRVLGFDTVLSMALGMSLGATLRLPEAHVNGLPPYWLDAVYTAATMEALGNQGITDLPPGDLEAAAAEADLGLTDSQLDNVLTLIQDSREQLDGLAAAM